MRIYAMLQEEMGILGEHHVKARTRRALWEQQYGQPFDQGNTNRLAFWVAQKKTMPLLFYVASILLTAPAASTDNERAHSVGGRVVSKTRCSLVGDSVDRNTTGYIWLRKKAAQKAEELKAKGMRAEDLEDHPDIDLLIPEEVEEITEEEEEIFEMEEDGEGAGGAGGAARGGGAAEGGGAGGGGGGGLGEGDD